MLLTRLILFLIRIKLGVKKYEKFQFTNQRSERDFYYFTSSELRKMQFDADNNIALIPAHVSLNWLLNPECKIRKIF